MDPVVTAVSRSATHTLTKPADDKPGYYEFQVNAAGTVMDMLRRVAAERRTAVIVVTHDEKIFNRFDHIYSLRDGAVEAPQSEAA